MNMFKNIFRHKPSKKENDELDRFLESKRENKENVKPKGRKGNNPLDVTATACYHTAVAPRSRRGPKSCPGGVSDGAHTNISFETVVPRRREANEFTSREAHGYNTTRHKRTGHAVSEFAVPSNKMHHISYMEVEMPSDTDNEEVDVHELKRKLKDTERQLKFMKARKNNYKNDVTEAISNKDRYKMELKEAQDAQRRINKAYKAQEEKYQKENQELRNENQMLKNALNNLQRQCTCNHQNMYTTSFAQNSMMGSNSYAMPPNAYPQPSNTFAQPPLFPSYSRAGTSSVIPDPQPTQNDLFAPVFNSSRFTNEDLDERKIFRQEDVSISLSTRDDVDLEDDDY